MTIKPIPKCPRCHSSEYVTPDPDYSFWMPRKGWSCDNCDGQSFSLEEADPQEDLDSVKSPA
jgi:hypothetical protein